MRKNGSVRIQEKEKKMTETDANESDIQDRHRTLSDEEDAKNNVIQSWMKEMDWKAKIGQMSQIEINLLLNDDKTALDLNKVNHYIGELGIGSVLNTISNPTVRQWSIADFRNASIRLQEVAHRYHRPPVIWGLDSVHGANYLMGTVTTPQPLNLASSFNTTLAYQAGQWASYDTRRAGIQWLFSPLVGLAWEPTWSRMYETFGEDPFLVGEMATNMVQGIQYYDSDKEERQAAPASSTTTSNSSNSTTTSASSTVTQSPSSILIPSRAAACAKHWIGYSIPHNGHDRAPSWIPTRHLYQYFVPPWNKVFDNDDNESLSKVLTVMESYTEIDGVPNVANRETLDYLLRRRMKFDGVLVTDFNEINNLANFHGVTQNSTTAVVQALQEGTVDMSMIPWNADDYRDAIEQHLVVETKDTDPNDVASATTTTMGGTTSSTVQHDKDDETAEEKKQNTKRDQSWISIERINTSVERVLQLKMDLNMFDENITMTNGGDGGSDVKQQQPSPQAVADALTMTHQTIILAKNDVLPNGQTVLPIPTYKRTTKMKVLVVGPTSNSLSYQTGGWTGQWQGVDPAKESEWFTYGHTVYGAAVDHPGWDVSFQCGVSIMGGDCDEHDDNNDSDQSSVLDKVKSWVGWGDEQPDISAYYSIERAIAATANVEYIIICVGEESYAEKPGDIRSLRLPEGQYELVEGLRQTTNPATTKIILVYFGGRPRLLQSMVVRLTLWVLFLVLTLKG
jgi:beta-glucosidase